MHVASASRAVGTIALLILLAFCVVVLAWCYKLKVSFAFDRSHSASKGATFEFRST